MAYKVHDITKLMDGLAPTALALEWDNVGLLLGSPQSEVSKVLVTLTITPVTVDIAVKSQVDLIIAHHPLLFRPLQAIRTDQPLGSMVNALLKHTIAVYACHTNLDQAPQGLNQWLAEDLGLREVKTLVPVAEGVGGLGRIGFVHQQMLQELANTVSKVWDTPVRVVGDPNRICEKVAVAGGSGGDLVHDAVRWGADCLITGDVSYHDALDALDNGLCVIDAGHHGTEKIMVQRVVSYLTTHLNSGVEILIDPGKDPFYFELGGD